MKKNISKIKYDNQSIPGFEFEIISLEEIYKKKLDHSLTVLAISQHKNIPDE